MGDITAPMSLVTSTPQEAAENITDSALFDMPADGYKDIKSDLKPSVDSFKRPAFATPVVTQYVSKSPEHAALAAPDVEKLSTMESQIATAGRKPGQLSPEEEYSNLKLKKQFKPDDFSDDDDLKMFQLETDIEEAKRYPPFEPKEHKDLINNATEAVKESSFFENTLNLLASGTSQSISTFAKTPALLHDLYFYPANLIRRAKGEPEITTPDAITNNPLVKTYGDAAEFFAERVPEAQQEVVDTVSKKGLAAGAEILAYKLAQNAPNQVAILVSAMASGGASLFYAGASTAADANYQNQAAGISPTGSLPNALAKGTIEAAFESLGTLGLLHSWEGALAKSFGKDSAGQIVKNVLKTLGHTFLGEGTEEGLTSGAQDITDYVSGVNPNALKGMGGRAIESVLVGGFSGLTMTAPTAIISGARSNAVTQNTTAINQSIKILNFGELFKSLSKESKSLEMYGHSPAEVSQLRQEMFSNTDNKTLYISAENAQEWASNPEKSKRLMDRLDPSGKTSLEYGGPVAVSTHDAMDLADIYPDIIDHLQLTAEGPSVDMGKAHLESLTQANEGRKKVLKKYKSEGVPTDLTPTELSPEDIAALDEARMPTESDIFGEKGFLEQPTFTDALKEVIPDTEINASNKAELEARTAIATNINDAATYDMEKTINVVEDAAIQTQFEIERDRVANDPNIAIVDKFTGFDRTPGRKLYNTEQVSYPEKDPSSLTGTHAKKGYSPVAIDPDLVPEKFKKYLKDPRLKGKKVFVKGGISPEQSARMVGINTAENLFKILLATPTRAEVVRQGVELRRQALREQAEDSVDLNKVALIKAYTDDIKNSLAKLTLLRVKNWTVLRKSLRRAALGVPAIQSIQTETAAVIGNATVGSLNVNVPKVGARKSQRLTFDALAKGDSTKGYIHLENYTRNQEMVKQTYLAIAKVNRVFKFAKKFNDKSVIAELKDAGFLDAANEILDVYHLSPSKAGTSERGAFNDYVQKSVEEGRPVTTIPERLQGVRQSANELSVDQVVALGNALSGILHMARLKNKLFNKFEGLAAAQYEDNIAEALVEEAKGAVGYDEKRINAEQVQERPELLAERAKELRAIKNSQERIQFLLMKMQGEKVVGNWTDTLWRPRVESESAAEAAMIDLDKRHKELIEFTLGDDMKKMAREWIDVPEFVGSTALIKGQMTKAQLLKALLNMGNEGNIKYVEHTFGVTREEFMKVVQRELDFKHMAYVQGVWNIFNSLVPEITALQKRTKGEEFIGVKVSPITFTKNGETRQYPGGYHPIQTKVDQKEVLGKRAVGATERMKQEGFRQQYYAEAMTEQGHLENREGGKSNLDLNLKGVGHGLAQVVHDLKNREAISDIIKLLVNPKIRDAMISVMGIEGYDNVMNNTIEWADAPSKDFNRSAEQAQKIIDFASAGMQSAALLGKIGTIAIQVASMPFLLRRMAASSNKAKGLGVANSAWHFTKILHEVTSNPQDLGRLYEFAAAIHPSIRASMEDFEGNPAMSFNKALPNIGVSGKAGILMNPLRDGLSKGAEIGFMTLGKMDEMLKVIGVNAAYSQAILGDVEGIEAGDVKAAKKYASDTAETTLTHNKDRNKSPIQKMKSLKFLTFFYSDLNNIFNNSVQVTREIRGSVKKGHYVAAVSTATAATLLYALANLIEDSVHGQPTPADDDDEDKTAAQQATDWAEYILFAPVKVALSTQPVIRDVTNVITLDWMKKKNVVFPLNKVVNDGANSIAGLITYLKTYGEIKPTRAQTKSMLYTAGYLTGKFPTGAVDKYILKYDFSKPSKSFKEVVEKGLNEQAGAAIDSFIADYEAKKFADITPEYIDQLKVIKNQLLPEQAVNEVPPETYGVIKQIASGNKWNAFNEKTGAAGVYQFTEKTWKEIQEAAPDLGLTDNGRVSRDASQQEKAIKWKTQQDTEALAMAGQEIAVDTVYMAHTLGVDKAITVLTATGDTKVKSIVGAEMLKENELSMNMKVKDFKDWVITKTFKAQSQIDKTSSNEKN